MRRFRQENQQHIREIFRRETGVCLPLPRRGKHIAFRTALALAIAAALGVTAVSAAGLFSPLEGDELALRASYRGQGIVTVEVENRSEKTLAFQKEVRLCRWKDQRELPAAAKPEVSGEAIPPHSAGTLTIDLSEAYDTALLEQPLEEGDSYYLLLTNAGFLFGHDWQCTVPFAEKEEETPPAEPAPAYAAPAPGELEPVPEPLRFYFQERTDDIHRRRELDEEYRRALEPLIGQQEGPVIPTTDALALLVSDPEPGVILDPAVPREEQGQLIARNARAADWDHKLLAAPGDHALVLSALVPMLSYPDAGGSIPLFYLFSYEKAAVTEDARLFVHGRFLTAAQAEEYLVYADGDSLCYDFSPLFYEDLSAHIQEVSARHPELNWDEQNLKRVEEIHAYYKENLGRLIYRR